MNEQEAKRLLKLIRQFSTKMAEKIDALTVALDRDFLDIQKELFNAILKEFLPKLETTRGVLIYNKANILLLARLDGILSRIESAFLTSRMTDLGAELLDVALSVKGYYLEIGQAAKTVERIADSLGLIETTIGINKDGKLIAGGYLDRLTRTQTVRTQIADFVLQSISSKASLKDYTNGLEGLIVGNKNTAGVLQKYYRQYAYDSYSQVSEISNREFANALDLKYFIYEGSIIDTTRAFCASKAGKVFSIEEALTEWPKDKNLLGDRSTYIAPLIERGRWNCRHMIRYIPDELAFYIRPELKQNGN